jgi:FMN reductase
MRLVCLSGNFTRPSRTRVLVEAVAAQFGSDSRWNTEVYDVLDAGPGLGTTINRDTAGPGHQQMWDAVRQCDALVVASPVYKASYTGLLKHFIDLLEMDILVGKPVLVGATGKAAAHALMIDHQFRPLFAFFRAIVIPSSLFALDADFASPDSLTEAMNSKVAAAASDLRKFAEGIANTG